MLQITGILCQSLQTVVLLWIKSGLERLSDVGVWVVGLF